MVEMVDWDEKTTVAEQSTPKKASQRDRAYLIVLAGHNVGEMYKVTKEAMILGRGGRANIQIIDEGISRQHARLFHDHGTVYVEDLGSTNGTYLNGNRVTKDALKDGDKIQIGSTTILKFTYHDRLDEHFQRHMYESALRDGLTKIFNKKYFLDRLDSEVAYTLRHQMPLSLILYDLDHFKKVNDRYGHLAGDFVLSQSARCVSDAIRGEDVFARYGGEEFVLICRGIDKEHGLQLAERLRKTIESHRFEFEKEVLPVTISIGLATLPHPKIKDVPTFVAAADEAMYMAKRTGRNRVVAFSGPNSK
jgi:diguanylate cyclase (GGDEF)-like protein